MAINSNYIQRPSDRSLFLTAAIGFPLVVLLGFYKSYYSRAFFETLPLPNSLVHLHGIVMTLWVLYFTMQVALVRTKNVRLHMTLGLAGIALAATVIIVGMATAYDSQFVRQTAPPGVEPFKFFLIPAFDMLLFALFFGGAIYFRKRPAEHKVLMLMTAINFLGSPISRIQIVPPEFTLPWAFGMPILLALALLVWHSVKHRKINKIFAASFLLFTISVPLRILIGETAAWHKVAVLLTP